MPETRDIKLSEYVTADEAARIAKLTPRRIRQIASKPNSGLDAQKIAGRWFIRRVSLQAYIEQER